MPKIGDRQFVSISELHPGQLRFARPRVEEKLVSLKAKFPAGPIFDQMRSHYPLEKAKKVLQTKYGPLLLDGHHAVLASEDLQGRTFPIEWGEDYTHLEGAKLWNELESKGLTYFHNFQGHRQVISSFKDMQDDPNRFLASLIAHRLDGEEDSPESIPKIWAKPPISVPFLEFHLADALYRHGINFIITSPPQVDAVLEKKIRQVLRYEKEQGNNPMLKKVELIP